MKPKWIMNKHQAPSNGLQQQVCYLGLTDILEPFSVLKDSFSALYPKDRRGEEADPMARVWHIYNDVAHFADTTMADGWNRSIDIHLVFVSSHQVLSLEFLLHTHVLL
jgi:hypothetical protein